MIEVCREDFSPNEAIARVKSPDIGGIVAYLGTVRSFSADALVEGLEFAVDAESALRTLQQIEEGARRDFAIADVAIVHRLGTLKVSDNILLIVVAAAHREPAFAACSRIVDQIKVAHAQWARERTKEA